MVAIAGPATAYKCFRYGDNEDLIGKWFKANPDKRNDIFLATKFAVKNMGAEIDSSPEYVKEAVEKSLQRLGIEQIDLYYCHRVDQKTPIELTVQAMADLVNLQKVKYLGRLTLHLIRAIWLL